MNSQWMIYGANGFTGKLIAKEAVKRGLNPILAGRNKLEIEKLANDLNLPYKIFDLSTLSTLRKNMSGLRLLLNCAGPFTKTAKPLLYACLENRCHYLDISGEISVFEFFYAQKVTALARNIIVCPGVAFDIVPTEAMAAKLKSLLPDADTLNIGFEGSMQLSRGSAITLLEGISNPQLGMYMVRENHQLKHLKKPRKTQLAFTANDKPKTAFTITWADIAAAYYSTGIPNIAVYTPANIMTMATFQLATHCKPILRQKPIHNVISKAVGSLLQGPSQKIIDSGEMHIVGEATNPTGKKVQVYLKTANGYKFSSLSAVAIAEHCLSMEGKSGYCTPSMLMDTHFVETLEGSSLFKIC